MDDAALTSAGSREELVPDAVIPHRHLPPLRYRDMPSPIPWRKMLGPSIMLAGLSLGSGEFILWPYITYQTGFIFFWACMLGVLTQFFLNMEIERWTLVTGESAITGFCRLSRQWAWVLLLLNIIPWAWPGWATGAGAILEWLLFGPATETSTGETLKFGTRYASYFGVAGLLLVGVVLTAGPVVYKTVERIQVVLVTFILIVVVLIACLVIRPDAALAMAAGTVNIGGMPDLSLPGLDLMMLLGALAFAGAGGTTNLGQSNFIKDKGYGMGRFIGRITSPLTGQQEATIDIGYHFHHTPDNMRRWKAWWRAANIEHFFSFFVTCVVCLCLMSLIAYSLFYDENGHLTTDMDQYGKGISFVWGQAVELGRQFGGAAKIGFLLMGIAVLLTTELGVLDVVARISTDIVKVNYLREHEYWSLSKLYFCFLWGEILLGCGILLLLDVSQPLMLFKISASLNGAVMFIYSLLLLYMNTKILPRSLSMGAIRFVVLVWSCAFFGYFTVQALRFDVAPKLWNSQMQQSAAEDHASPSAQTSRFLSDRPPISAASPAGL